MSYDAPFRLRPADSPSAPVERVERRDERTQRAYDPTRFAKGYKLAVAPHETEPRAYWVASESVKGKWYMVRLDGDQRCECDDLYWRERRIAGNCKHILAARLQERDPALVPALAELLYQLQSNLAQYMKRRKRKGAA